MKQYSDDGTPIEIEVVSGHLIFIDPLYLEDIKDSNLKISFFDTNLDFVKSIEKDVFPHGGGNLIGYKRIANKNFALSIHDIKHFGFENLHLESQGREKKITIFSSDSGGIIIMDMINFESIINLIDINSVISLTKYNSLSYIEEINRDIGSKAWAYVHNPGIGNGFDFVGSGSFLVNR